MSLGLGDLKLSFNIPGIMYLFPSCLDKDYCQYYSFVFPFSLSTAL